MATPHPLILLAFRLECNTSAPITTQPRSPCIDVNILEVICAHDLFGLPRRHVPNHHQIRRVFSEHLRLTEKVSLTRCASCGLTEPLPSCKVLVCGRGFDAAIHGCPCFLPDGLCPPSPWLCWDKRASPWP